MTDKITPSAEEQARGVLAKLLLFTVMLGVVPIGSYFGTLDLVWHGNTTMAAITAIVSANVILLAYILISIFEDAKVSSKDTTSVPPEENKKER